MKITTEMTEAAYSICKDVYTGRISKENALDSLVNVYGMNRNSAADYVNNFKQMMNGVKYARTNNGEATEYFLQNIYADYGPNGLRNALSAVQQHINYYEGLGRGKLLGIRRLVAEFTATLKAHKETLYPDEIEGSEQLHEKTKKTIIVNSYERNPSELDADGQRLLSFLVRHLENVEPGDHHTYVGYKAVHEELGLRLRGATWGRSLKWQGLSSLAEWTKIKVKPAITGIIIDTGTGTPGPGYFGLFGKTEDDTAWWADQVRLSKEYDWTPYLPLSAIPQPPMAIDIEMPVGREEITTYRIIRDTSLSRKVKVLHHYKCQLCGYYMALPDGSYYAEAHHIRPLGNPHNGPDVMENILCLCPNHHAELDYGVSRIEPDRLTKAPVHSVGISYIGYHNENIFKAKP